MTNREQLFLECGEGLNARTVGELKEILNLLPDDFKIEQGFSKGVTVTCYKGSVLDFYDLQEC